MADTNLIMNLPVLPVKRTVLFPGVLIPLTVGRDRSVAAVEAALKTEDKTILVVAQRDPHTEEPGLDDLYTIGTKAVIKQTDFENRLLKRYIKHWPEEQDENRSLR